MRAVTKNYDYSISKTGASDLKNLTSEYKKMHRQVLEEFNKLYLDGKLTKAEFINNIHHEIWERLSEKLKLNYRRDKI